MYRFLSFLICLILFTSFIANSKTSDSLRVTSKWNVNLDLYNLISRGEASLMVKRLSPKNGAYRFGVSGSWVQDKTSGLDTLSNWSLVQKRGNIGLTFGYEWIKRQGRKQLYYGLDLNVVHRSYTSNASDKFPQILGSKSFSTSLAPFIGVRYRLCEAISLSMEGSIFFAFTSLNNLESDNKTIANGVKTFGITYTPVRFINLVYHF